MSNEWYTRAKYIDAARAVMGSIDLDPASCAEANQIVRATRYHTSEENGLLHDWQGNVWLNPPYTALDAGEKSGRMRGGSSTAKSLIRQFLFKLLHEYEIGHVAQAITLVTSDTDASWFQPLWQFPICFATHRVTFLRPGAEARAQFFGTCFVYLGPNESAFIEHFSRFGRIARAIDVPKPRPVACELWP